MINKFHPLTIINSIEIRVTITYLILNFVWFVNLKWLKVYIYPLIYLFSGCCDLNYQVVSLCLLLIQLHRFLTNTSLFVLQEHRHSPVHPVQEQPAF